MRARASHTDANTGFIVNSAHDADSITALRLAIRFVVVVANAELNKYSPEYSLALK